jgi:hypothetical protein
MYIPEYKQSWALVIGINNYKFAPPLEYACNDAKAVAEILIDRFSFQEENIILLTNESASREIIINSFLKFAHNSSEDDRIIVFFAGHGYTFTGKRGEIGYLVPADGTSENLATLIRWDDLTKNADVIPAKHLLFIMDACYGGIAITRTISPGSMRFLKDMLQRYSRQVLTAGKADEVVADSGGPIPGHSVFTGHFLEALSGKAATSDGIISANSVMAYVYDRVGKDLNSRQTPHYGHIDGDGDFIFLAPKVNSIIDSLTDLNVIDSLILKIACEKAIKESYLFMNFKEIRDELNEFQIPKEDIFESFEILGRRGYLKIKWSVTEIISSFSITTYGFDEYAKIYLKNYDGILKSVILNILNNNIEDNRQLAENLKEPIMIINHFLNLLESRGLIRILKSANEEYITIHHISAELKRAFR